AGAGALVAGIARGADRAIATDHRDAGRGPGPEEDETTSRGRGRFGQSTSPLQSRTAQRRSTRSAFHHTIIAPGPRPLSVPSEVERATTMAMTVQEEMAQAFWLHRAGELAEAAGHYEAILVRDP